MAALPTTTSAMDIPAVPPMRKLSDEVTATAASASPVCVQSSSLPLSPVVLFSLSSSPVPTSWTPGTPCNCARPNEADRPTYLRLEDPLPVKTAPSLRLPPSRANPTASGSPGDGRSAWPYVGLPTSRSRRAPSPMNSLASPRVTASNSASIRADASSGSRMFRTVVRRTSTLALPYTTPAIPRATLPPNVRFPSCGPRPRSAGASAFVARPDCVQSSRLPPKPRLSFSVRLAPSIWTSGIPCSWARPSMPSNAR